MQWGSAGAVRRDPPSPRLLRPTNRLPESRWAVLLPYFPTGVGAIENTPRFVPNSGRPLNWLSVI